MIYQESLFEGGLQGIYPPELALLKFLTGDFNKQIFRRSKKKLNNQLNNDKIHSLESLIIL
jgi:hypothetical protein